jgi:hypothetical protein
MAATHIDRVFHMQIEGLTNWFMAHANLLWIMGSISLVMFVGTILALPLIIIYLPARFFNPSAYAARRSENGLSTWRLCWLVLKNVLGAGLILAGLVMLVLPGQGLVTLLIGLSLVAFPGKRRLVCRLLRQPGVLGFINRIRTAAHRPPVAPPNLHCTGDFD